MSNLRDAYSDLFLNFPVGITVQQKPNGFPPRNKCLYLRIWEPVAEHSS